MINKDDLADAERICKCCEGVGTIDERLGGEWNSNPTATCPDCDGRGYYVLTERNKP